MSDGRLPADEQTLTIRPSPRCAIRSAAARIRRIGAITCSSHIAFQSSSVRSCSERAKLVPALLTSTSIPPICSAHVAMIRSSASGSVMSAAR